MKKIMYHLEYILILPLAIMSILSSTYEHLVLTSVAICLAIQTLCYIFLATNKHRLKVAAGVISFINGAFGIVALLLLAIANLPNEAPLYYTIYTFFYLGFKIFTFFYYMRIKNDLTATIYKEYSIVVIVLIVNLLLCILLYNFDDNENLPYMINILFKVFVEEYNGYDTLKFYLILIKIIVNFFTSTAVAYFTSSTLILILKNTPLTMRGKIQSVSNIIVKYNIPFFMSEATTTFLLINYSIRVMDNNHFTIMAIFYFVILVLKTMMFIWNASIKRNHKDEPYIVYRRQCVILLVTSAAFITLTSGMAGVLSFVTSQNNNPNAFPIWWLLLIILPFSGYGFVMSVISYRKSKIDDDPYLLAYSNLSCISSMYMLFGSLIYVISMLPATPAIITWFVLFSAVLASQLIISIKSLVIAIQGLKGNRKKPEDFINKVVDQRDESQTIIDDELNKSYDNELR